VQYVLYISKQKSADPFFIFFSHMAQQPRPPFPDTDDENEMEEEEEEETDTASDGEGEEEEGEEEEEKETGVSPVPAGLSRADVVEAHPVRPLTRLVFAENKFIRSYWVTQTLEQMRIATLGIFVLDLAVSILVLIMMWTLLDTVQVWLTLWQVMHIFSWLLILTCAFIYDLGWVTAVLVIYIIALLFDITGFIWRIVDLAEDDLNTFYTVTLGIQTAAVGFLWIFDIIAIIVLSVMRKQLFPSMINVTDIDQVVMFEAYASKIEIVRAARKRMFLDEFLKIWHRLEKQSKNRRRRRGREDEDHSPPPEQLLRQGTEHVVNYTPPTPTETQQFGRSTNASFEAAAAASRQTKSGLVFQRRSRSARTVRRK
jgi:hypothetical protein